MGLVPDENIPLTVIDNELELKRRSTYPGMAHFAGTGPPQATCRECVFWTGCGLDSGYYSKTSKWGPTLKARACDKHRHLMNDVIGKAIPYYASACKHFERNPEPPKIERTS